MGNLQMNTVYSVQVPRLPSNFTPEIKTKFKDFSGEI